MKKILLFLSVLFIFVLINGVSAESTTVDIVPIPTYVIAGQEMIITIIPGEGGISPHAYIEKDGSNIVKLKSDEFLPEDPALLCSDLVCPNQIPITITFNVPGGDDGWKGIYYFKYTAGSTGNLAYNSFEVYEQPPTRSISSVEERLRRFTCREIADFQDFEESEKRPNCGDGCPANFELDSCSAGAILNFSGSGFATLNLDPFGWEIGEVAGDYSGDYSGINATATPNCVKGIITDGGTVIVNYGEKQGSSITKPIEEWYCGSACPSGYNWSGKCETKEGVLWSIVQFGILDFVGHIGQALGDVVEGVVGGVVAIGVGVIGGFGDVVTGTINMVGTIFSGDGNIFENVWNGITHDFLGGFVKVIGRAANVLEVVADHLISAGSHIAGAVVGLFDKDAGDEVYQAINDGLGGFVDEVVLDILANELIRPACYKNYPVDFGEECHEGDEIVDGSIEYADEIGAGIEAANLGTYCYCEFPRRIKCENANAAGGYSGDYYGPLEYIGAECYAGDRIYLDWGYTSIFTGLASEKIEVKELNFNFITGKCPECPRGFRPVWENQKECNGWPTKTTICQRYKGATNCSGNKVSTPTGLVSEWEGSGCPTFSFSALSNRESITGTLLSGECYDCRVEEKD